MRKKTKVTTASNVTRIEQKKLPEWLARRMHGSTLTDFAEEIGSSREAISALLHGRREPGPALRKRLGIRAVEKVYIVDAE